jgi:hypothetical protein
MGLRADGYFVEQWTRFPLGCYYLAIEQQEDLPMARIYVPICCLPLILITVKGIDVCSFPRMISTHLTYLSAI